MVVCTHNGSNKDSTSLRLQIPLLTCWPPAVQPAKLVGWLDLGTSQLANVKHSSSMHLTTIVQLQLDICTIQHISIKPPLQHSVVEQNTLFSPESLHLCTLFNTGAVVYKKQAPRIHTVAGP